MPTALLIDHIAQPPADRIMTHLASRGLTLRRYRFGGPGEQPAPGEQDIVVVLPGPEPISAIAADPEKRAEFNFVDQCVGAGIPMLGVGLGAAIMAHSAGATVRATSRGVEHGYARIDPTPRARGLIDRPMRVFSFSEEGFGLPFGARRLAGSAVFPNQAVRFDRATYGVQFRPELDPRQQIALMAELVEAEGMIPGEEERLQREIAQHDATQAEWLGRFLDVWLAEAFGHSQPA